MQPEAHPRLTAEEYLALERAGGERHEFLDGEVVAMAGASRLHNLVVSALVASLHPRLGRRGCEIYSSDMRVHIPAVNVFTYPDVVVVCGEPRFADDAVDTLLNPTVLMEVLPAATEDYDRGRKFAYYRTLPSLASYLLLSQNRVHVEHFSRQEGGPWTLWEADDPGAEVELPALGCSLSVSEIYARMPAGWAE